MTFLVNFNISLYTYVTVCAWGYHFQLHERWRSMFVTASRIWVMVSTQCIRHMHMDSCPKSMTSSEHHVMTSWWCWDVLNDDIYIRIEVVLPISLYWHEFPWTYPGNWEYPWMTAIPSLIWVVACSVVPVLI